MRLPASVLFRPVAKLGDGPTYLHGGICAVDDTVARLTLTPTFPRALKDEETFIGPDRKSTMI